MRENSLYLSIPDSDCICLTLCSLCWSLWHCGCIVHTACTPALCLLPENNAHWIVYIKNVSHLVTMKSADHANYANCVQFRL